MDDMVVRVQRLQGRYQLALETHTPVRAVVYDRDLVADSEIDEGLPTLERHRQPCGIVKVGNVVNELRHRLALARELRQQRRELADIEPALILPDLEKASAEAPYDRDGAEVRRLGDDYGIAFIEQHSAYELDRVLGAVGHEHIVGRHLYAVGGQVPGDPLSEIRESSARRVLERLGSVSRESGFALSGQVGKHTPERRGRSRTIFCLPVGRPAWPMTAGQRGARTKPIASAGLRARGQGIICTDKTSRNMYGHNGAGQD